MMLTIKGNVPSQKNRKIISVNRATGRPFLRSAPAVKEWQESALYQIKAQWKNCKVTGYPISLVVVVYFDSLRRRDLDNALSSIMDALVAAGVIEDDNVNFVDSISVQYGGHDKLNPRVEIHLDD
jgi:Holliday junction resolvase RusA-like endonuclease